jgi:hypothetical protein
MVRFSVSLTDDQNQWVEDQADSLNGSKSQVIGMLVEQARTDGVQLQPQLSGESTAETEELRNQLNSIQERLEGIEKTIDIDSTPSQPSESNSSETADRMADASEPSTRQAIDAETPRNESQPTKSEQEDSAPASNGLNGDVDDVEVDAVKSFVDRTVADEGLSEAVIGCWQFLKKRGTASPDSFKDHCLAEAAVDADWESEIEPVLRQLPGVVSPEEGGRFYRFKY